VTLIGNQITLTFEHCKGNRAMIDTLDTGDQ